MVESGHRANISGMLARGTYHENVGTSFSGAILLVDRPNISAENPRGSTCKHFPGLLEKGHRANIFAISRMLARRPGAGKKAEMFARRTLCGRRANIFLRSDVPTFHPTEMLDRRTVGVVGGGGRSQCSQPTGPRANIFPRWPPFQHFRGQSQTCQHSPLRIKAHFQRKCWHGGHIW